mgnify:CR=1 FL=1
MASVEIYTKATCGYCAMAKRLLKSKDVSFTETDLLREPEKRAEMIERSGGRQTVPQVFIDGEHIGGFDDLSGLDMAGKLDPLLAA